MQRSDLTRIVNQLGGKENGDGWKCLCPAHDDKNPSLSLTIKDGKLVGHCFAGCPWPTVKTELLRLVGDTPKTNIRTFSEPEVTYKYFYPTGELAFEKCRFNGKNFKIRKENRYKDVIKNLPSPAPLYYEREVIEGIENDYTIVICEGEKDVENIRRLNIPGIVATTNFDGGNSWREHYTTTLNNATRIIVLEDNDEAGRKRTAKLTDLLISPGRKLQLDRYTELPPGGDISDWLALGNTQEDLLLRWAHAPVLLKVEGVKDDDKKKEARQEDYYDLFRSVLGDLRKDLFSGELLFPNSEGLWIPALNKVDRLKADCFEQRHKKFNGARVLPYLSKLEEETPGQLIPEIPDWDGHDHITDFCAHVVCSEMQESFAPLFAEWLANIFKRLHDPHHRNFIFVLQGEQSLGKDYWVDTATMALGQWASPMHITTKDKDLYMQLHESAVLKISEFDKASRMESSVIKDLVTTPTTKIRASYAKSAQTRFARCSFIATCNVDDILRDSTGNSRYVIFKLKLIDRDYKMEIGLSRNLLAQAKHLAATGYVAPEEAWRPMRQNIADQTPDDPGLEIVEYWCDAAVQYLTKLPETDAELIRNRGWIKNTESGKLLNEVASAFKISMRKLQRELKHYEMNVRTEADRGYKLEIEKHCGNYVEF